MEISAKAEVKRINRAALVQFPVLPKTSDENHRGGTG